MKRTIKIHIAGQQYQIRSDADEGYVHSLAAYVDSRVNALKGSRQVATQSDVVLAALQMADELSLQKREQSRLRGQVRVHAERMIEQLGRLTASGTAALPSAAARPSQKTAPAARRSVGARAGKARHP